MTPTEKLRLALRAIHICSRRALPGGVLAALMSATFATTAFAAEAGSGASEVVFLAQLLALIFVGRVLGELINRIGQPSVMGMLLGGILLGPSVLGALWPDLHQALFPKSPVQKALLDGIAQFGVLLLLLLTGMETDLRLIKKIGKAAISVSLTGVSVPFLCGFALGQFMPEALLPSPEHRLLTSLFLGTALSISSIKIVAAILREMDFTRRNLGQIIVASAICEDSIGWVIIAITLSLAEAGTIDLMSITRSVAGTAVFLIASFTVGRRIVFILIRWVNDNFQSDFPVITTILVIMGVMALTTHVIGVHTVLGAFVAGVLVGESPILSKHIDAQLRGLILAFFMPVFFGIAGLSADLTVLREPTLAMLAFGLILIASFGKFAGAFIGGAIGGLSLREAFALGCGMNARGSTEVIVAKVGLSIGALSQSLFTMIVFMALATTMAMPPMLRWALARVPVLASEKERLIREEQEAKGFLPNLERLLLAVDASPNGKFAAQLAGFIAGPRGMPTTLLWLQRARKEESAARERPPPEHDAAAVERAEAVKTAALSAQGPGEVETPSRTSIEVTIRTRAETPSEAVAAEAAKGYDLMVVGTQHTRARSGGFHSEVSRIAGAFEGPLLLVAGREQQLERPEQSFSSILVPVTGTDVSRRAAEVAIAIGRACNARISVLYVSQAKAKDERRLRGLRARRQEQAILKDIVEIADRCDAAVATAVRGDTAPDEAILAEAKKARHDLIVMGANRRPGEQLFAGETADAVFERSPSSVALLVS